MSVHVCDVCGSTDFGDPRDGLFFCLECGTQSQDVRVEVSQIEDGGGFTRTLRKKKGKSKKKDGAECTDSDSHALETFQRIMKRQCDALIALGFNSSVKEAARLIWFTYLKHYGYAFRDQTQGTRPSCSDGKQDPLAGDSQPPNKPSLGAVSTPSRCQSSYQSQPHNETDMLVLSEKSGRKRCQSGMAPDAKRVRMDSGECKAGFDTFPDDKFLFESGSSQVENAGSGKETVKMDASESVRIMEGVSSWEELDELERTMDCRQLLMFRQAYLSARNSKPKFVGKGERWGSQPRVFKQYMTISVLYLALLYTEQPVLPVDIVRWVRLEKIPLNTPLEKSARFRNSDNLEVFFTTTLVTTVGVIDQAFKLYHNLPLPPVPNPDPHAISHIIINRLQLTECFKGLVDKALDTVYLPVGFTHRYRMDSECAAVIIIMLKILYGLDDHMEMDSSIYSGHLMKPVKEEAGGRVTPTTANSLPVWVDWVELYCTHVSKAPEEGVPFSSQELSKVKNYQSYFQFCRETVFTKCRPVPIRAKSYRELDPAFGRKIAEIFSSSSQSSDSKPTTDTPPTPSPRPLTPPPPPSSSDTPPTPSPQPTTPPPPPSSSDTPQTPSLRPPTPPPPPSSSDTPPTPSLRPPTPPPSSSDTSEDLRLVPLINFLQNPKAPCTTYRPLPTSHQFRQDLDENQLSHAMRFILSMMCQLIDIPLRNMYTMLLSVEKAFVKGLVIVLKNLTHDFL